MVWTRWVNISKVPPMISPIQQRNVVKQCVTLVVTYDLWGFHIRGQRVQLVLFKCQVNKKILPWIDHATKLDPELLCELQNLLFCWTLYRNMFNNKTFFLWSPPSYWWSGFQNRQNDKRMHTAFRYICLHLWSAASQLHFAKPFPYARQ